MEKVNDIASLLKETGHAYHQAFIATDGADPEWALWYTDYLEEPLSRELETSLTRSHIVHELVDMDDKAAVSDTPWPLTYAQILLKKYGK